jgi:hypothetical protein
MKKPAPIDFATQLEAIPVHNTRAKIESSPDKPGVLSVTVDLKYAGYKALLARVLKPRYTRTYQVTGLSLELFNLMDGKTTIDALIDYLMEQHKLTFFEARALVLKYTHDLMQRGMIAVAGE